MSWASIYDNTRNEELREKTKVEWPMVCYCSSLSLYEIYAMKQAVDQGHQSQGYIFFS